MEGLPAIVMGTFFLPRPPAEDFTFLTHTMEANESKNDRNHEVWVQGIHRPRPEQRIVPPQRDLFHRLRQKLFRVRIAEVDRYQEHVQILPKTEKIPVLALRRKTTLFGFLLGVCQFALVDTYFLLPIGMILYSMGIGCLVELLETYDGEEEVAIFFPWPEPSPEQQRLEEESRSHYRQQRKSTQEDWKTTELRSIQDLVDFEFRVLLGQHHSPRVVPREEHGKLVYYTV